MNEQKTIMAAPEVEKRDLVAVIMAGGVGTRFWPLSTEGRPKQFLKLFDDRSLLQKSFDRISDLIAHDRILVLTNLAFTDLVGEQLPEIPPENIIGEPFRRDTAAAVCLGAAICRKRFGNPVILTLTADHMIEPIALFHKALLSAAREAQATGALYTFGVLPTYAATGYGYLELGPVLKTDDGVEHYRLIRFKEKPDRETAGRYVESKRFRWNSGMFAWTTDAILKALEEHLPGHFRAIAEAAAFDRTPGWPEALRTAFKSLDPISIDYAVMEKAKDIRCVGCAFSWMDVGGWLALKDFLPQDLDGNHFRGQMICKDAHDNLIFCEDEAETVMLVGVKDLVAVRAGKRTLIIHKEMAEAIKEMVDRLPKPFQSG